MAKHRRLAGLVSSFVLAPWACSSPSETGSGSSASYASEQTDPAAARTLVLLDEEPALGSMASIRLAVVEQLDGSAERWLGYATSLAEPSVQVVLSIGPIADEAGQAVLQENAASTLSLDGQAYEVVQGTIDYRAESSRAVLASTGVGRSTLNGSERRVALEVSGELWRPCFYRGHPPGQPVATGPDGNPSPLEEVLDEDWSSEFCQAQTRD